MTNSDQSMCRLAPDGHRPGVRGEGRPARTPTAHLLDLLEADQ